MWKNCAVFLAQLLLLGGSMVSCFQEVSVADEKGNKDRVRLVEVMYNEDLEVADRLFHPDCRHHINGSEEALKGARGHKANHGSG